MGRPVRLFLTAGTAGEPVPSKSAFVPAFIRALDGAADLMRDRYVTGTEIGVYIHRELAGTGQTPQFGKLPDVGMREGDFVFRLAPLPVPTETSFSLEDLERRADWAEYLAKMKSAFSNVESYEARSVEAALKAQAWQRFTSTFDDDDPFSEEDEALRHRAAERLAYWQRNRESPPPPVPSPPPPTRVVHQAGDGWTESVLKMRFRYVPSGTFQMGSPEDEQGRLDRETLHTVKLTRSFWIGENEVTQGQWKQLIENNPAHFDSCGDDCPVEQVSWWDAVTFANRLSEQAGLESCYDLDCQGTPGQEGYSCRSVTFRGLDCGGFRLPTEAEWERAARAGSREATYGGDLTLRGDCDAPELKAIAWYCGNSKRKTHPAGQKQANGWGLHDMLGNVWEWVWDAYEAYDGDVENPVNSRGGSRVLRGGGWYGIARVCRAAYRGRAAPRPRNDDVGFRLVRTSD